MFRIDVPTAANALPAPSAPSTPGYWTKGDPGAGAPVPATVMDQDYCNMVQEELCNVVAAASLTLSKSTYTQLRDAIQALITAGTLQPFLNHASAATCDIGAAVSGMTSRNANITGTTTITALGSSASASNPIYVTKFAASLTLTHNAASLILPGGGNIVTQAGDYAFWEYLGSGNWRAIAYHRADATGPQMPQTRVVVKIDGATGNQSNKIDPAGYLSSGAVRTAQGTYHLAHSSTGWPANAYCLFCLHDSSNKAGVSLQVNNAALLEIGVYDTTVAGTLDASFTVEIKW